ncbi:hypothetical protein V496_03161 [Pseudogymnoascus sp. VKM F-4515 (FW-2607)]|nr:hypothetical protein V496_03161 [Pseudogymnoascus sp. VKM F-4515 (FW-2607)]
MRYLEVMSGPCMGQGASRLSPARPSARRGTTRIQGLNNPTIYGYPLIIGRYLDGFLFLDPGDSFIKDPLFLLVDNIFS